uniref:Uncharacterized protein n=1 Tax=Fagus sylvatica TaxID=28930 RepID=A0A2N9F4I1_FAGSY
MKKKAGPPHCPLVLVDSITKPSAAAPVEARSDGEDGTRVERFKRSAMAAQANTTQGQRPQWPSTSVVLAHPHHEA